MIVNFSTSEQTAFLRSILTHPNHGNLRTEIINTVYQEIFGENAPASVKAEWNTKLADQKKLSSAAILRTELMKLYMANETPRRKAIDNAFQYGMGRPATNGEQTNWLAKKVIYKVIAAAQPSLLYTTPTGLVNDDLSQTVDRVFLVETGKKPATSDKKKTDFINFISPSQPPYNDMFFYYKHFFHPI